MTKISKNAQVPQCDKTAVISRFVSVKLKRDTVEDMISTYEFLVWSNVGDEKKACKKIIEALKKSLL
jgi:hypothetical protein